MSCGGTFILRRPASALRTFTTSWPATENPVSQGGIWTPRGLTDGLDWTNPQTVPGIFFGTQTGDDGDNDSISLIAGPWTNDIDITGTVHIGTRPGTFAEIALLLRGAISAHSAKLYECYFSCAASPNRYAHITRWEGPFNSFTDLVSLDNSTAPTLNNGDLVRATIVGTLITVYVQGAQVMQHDISGDTTKWTTGLPGMSNFAQTLAANSNWGWSSVTCKDFGA